MDEMNLSELFKKEVRENLIREILLLIEKEVSAEEIKKKIKELLHK
ncbi:hypothetical protein JXA27_09955 [Aerococcaceae bacterium zg-B36]|nr:hypothetical protein [Aerococcaceae bacterium zg-B36]